MFQTKQLTYKNKPLEVIYTEIHLGNKTIVFGYSKGRNINFHPSADTNLEASKFVLHEIGLDTQNLLKPQTEHDKKVEVNQLTGDADGLITTKDQTLIMTPADCVIFGVIDNNSGYYGLGHSGRRGVGLNIAEEFIHKFHTTTDNSLDLKVFLAPHIAGNEYPHENDSFIKDENGNENWWANHPELYKKEKDTKSYPNIGEAVRLQLKEASSQSGNAIEITLPEESTFSGNYHSNSRDKNLTDGLKLRNLVFIGVKK